MPGLSPLGTALERLFPNPGKPYGSRYLARDGTVVMLIPSTATDTTHIMSDICDGCGAYLNAPGHWCRCDKGDK